MGKQLIRGPAPFHHDTVHGACETRLQRPQKPGKRIDYRVTPCTNAVEIDLIF